MVPIKLISLHFFTGISVLEEASMNKGSKAVQITPDVRKGTDVLAKGKKLPLEGEEKIFLRIIIHCLHNTTKL